MNTVIYEIQINNGSINPMQQTWKTAWTCVPFTSSCSFTFTWWTFVTFRTT